MSKETKTAKKEMKAQKKAAKVEKAQSKEYAKYVKKVEKENAKAEKKANKKNKPFVPIVIPTQEELFAGVKPKKAKNTIKMIILLILILYIIYFLFMWFQYVAPPYKATEEDTNSEPAVYERYVNEHEITTTPNYDVSVCKEVLKQTIKDNYTFLGYGSDPSSSAINQTGMKTINNVDCYEFSCAGKTYYVARNISGVYVNMNGENVPLTFHGVEGIFTK